MKSLLKQIVQHYTFKNIHIGCLGSHSALEIAYGAKKVGLKTVVVCQKGREKTYSQYYRNLFDKVIVVKAINPDKDATEAANQFELLKRQLPDREVIFVEGNIITKLFANNVRNPHLIRGLRNGEDLIYEEVK